MTAVKAVSLLNSMDAGPTKSSSSAEMIVFQVSLAIIDKTNYCMKGSGTIIRFINTLLTFFSSFFCVNVFQSVATTSSPITEKTNISNNVSMTVSKPNRLVKIPAVKTVPLLNSTNPYQIVFPR